MVTNCVIHYIDIKSYSLDITIHRLNNCGQKFKAYNNILNYTESCKYTLPNGAEINIY